MADWLSYSLHDFLLFSPDVYWRLLACYSESSMSLAIAIELMAVIAFAYVYRTRKYSVVALLNIVLLAVLGAMFYMQHFATINTFAPYLAYACFAQSFLLVLYLFKTRIAVISTHNDNFSKVNLTSINYAKLPLVCLAVIILSPWVAVFLSFTWHVGIVGILPIPTLILVLISSFFYSRLWRFVLLPIPFLLLVIELLTLKVVLS